MVLAQKVGRKRGFAVGLLLTIVTFGIYAIYWNYRAHNELYRQFELEREGRDEGMVWYVLGLTLQPLLVAYLWIFASNVSYLRDRIGLARRMTPGKFVALAGSGVGGIALAIVLLAVATFALEETATQEEVSAAVDDISAYALALSLAGAVVIAVAYHGLQRDINELWDAYDARMHYLQRHPEALAARPTYMADLGETTAAGIASHALAEVHRLRERHPDLRALPDLEALLGRAQSGDAEAREAAETLLHDLVGVLHERAELMRRREEREAAGETDVSDLDERLGVLDQALFAR